MHFPKPKENTCFYNYKLKKWTTQEDKKKQYLEQLKLVEKDKARLTCILEGNTEKAEKLAKELADSDYMLYTVRIKYREVLWGDLLSDLERTSDNRNTPFCYEKREYSKKVLKCLGYGLSTSAFLSALVFPTFLALDFRTVMQVIINTISLIFFMVRGVIQSKEIVLGSYVLALEKRKMIYSQMAKDIKISNIVIVEKE